MLGGADWDDVPISRAVAASTALPMVYKPVEIKGRHLVDGGIRSTTNVDVAVERGGEVRDRGEPAGALRERLPEGDPDDAAAAACGACATWASRRSATRRSSCSPTSACTRRSATGRRRYPGVDIILIEPDPNDELMFETNILNFTRRVEIARHGFESVTLKLASEYDEPKAICAKHGIEISATRVRKVVREFARGARARGAAGGASSSRRPARCCGSPKTPSSRAPARGERSPPAAPLRAAAR